MEGRSGKAVLMLLRLGFLLGFRLGFFLGFLLGGDGGDSGGRVRQRGRGVGWLGGCAAGAEGVGSQGWGWVELERRRAGSSQGGRRGGVLVGNAGDWACTMGRLGAARNDNTAVATANATATTTAAAAVTATTKTTATTIATATAAAPGTGTAFMM